MTHETPFWESKTLSEMSTEEWESLCDGCAKCCLVKLEDEDIGELHYTSVVCRYLDQENCRCTCYQDRTRLVPTCLKLEPGELETIPWMPSTCAYRLLYEGKKLPLWHPLISGNRKTMVRDGHSINDKVLSEEFVPEEGLEDYIIEWVK